MEQKTQDRFTYTWNIENMNIFYDCLGITILSPNFIFPSLPRLKWYLCLKNASDGDANSMYISVRRVDDFPETCSIKYFIQLRHFEGKLIKTFEKEKQVFDELSNFEYVEALEKRLFKDLKNNTLSIKFNLEKVCEANGEETFPAFSYKNASFTDVSLCAGGAVYKVHKAILYARWPKLLEKLDKEKKCQQVMYIRPNVLEAMIEYVYTGKVDCNNDKILVEINAAAAEYGLNLHTMPQIAKKLQTRIKVQEISFKWAIENFLSLPVETKLYSQVFSFYGEKKEEPHRLALIFCKRDRGFKIFIRKIHDKESNPFYVESKISLLGSNSQGNKHTFKDDDIWECAEFSYKTSSNRNPTVLLNCQFTFSDCSCFHEATELSCAFTSTIYCYDFYSDLKFLYETGNLSDVDIKVGLERFLAHKFILSAQSTVFSKIFATEMIESGRSVVEISNVDPDIVNEFLTFMYCGQLTQPLKTIAKELYPVAAKYNVSRLKEICSTFLQCNVDCKNVRQLLKLAHFSYDEALYKSVLEFTCEHAEDVFATDEWKRSEKDESVAKLLQDVLLKIK